jgi:HAD superfamily hydrolase (TIGR01459 family)
VTICIEGLRVLAPRYAGFIVDQWGVIHDGVQPYPEALDCLEQLGAAGGRIVLLSNTGSRTGINVERLRELGIDPALADAVVTSGEATWQAFCAGDPAFRQLGRRCLHWTRGGDRSVVTGTDLETVGSVEAADFILLTGTDDDARLDDFRAALDAARARALPLVCANPDVRVVSAAGVAMAPGALAAHYEALGGRVIWVGKPHPRVYRRALDLLPAGPVLAVGDSLAHDIAGGAARGLDTAFVLAGIHAEAFALDQPADAEPNRRALQRLAGEFGVSPTYAMTRFRW